jgi:hypothetical protein
LHRAFEGLTIVERTGNLRAKNAWFVLIQFSEKESASFFLLISLK